MKAAILGLGLITGVACASGCSRETVESAKRDAENAADKAEVAADQAVEKGKDVAADLKADFAAALSKAKDSIRDIKDGPELMQELSSLMEIGRQALEDAKSSETAESAKTKLAEVETSMEKLGERLKDAPDQLKQGISRLVERGRDSLNRTVENIKADPKVSDDVKSAIDRFLAKLDSLKAG